MKKDKQKRLFSLMMIVALLATSTLACAVTFADGGDIHSASTYQKASDSPYSADQQLPFEEKEKEFEDRYEADEKGNGFGIDLYSICDLEREYNQVDRTLLAVEASPTAKKRPLFLSHHTLLI